jgi:5-methylcytosine-specific restriction endonuclease McrA
MPSEKQLKYWELLKGKPTWNKGIKTGLVPRTAFKKGVHYNSATEFKKGVSASPSTQFKKGMIPFNKGKKMQPHSQEAKDKISESLKLQWANGVRILPKGLTMKGHHWKVKDTSKMSESRTGEKNWRWITDRTIALERHQEKNSLDWKQWRMEVFSRDKYTCQECGDSGVYIEPHHIVPLRSDRSKIFEVTNGITLCRPCHMKTFGKESNFTEKYSAIVVAH